MGSNPSMRLAVSFIAKLGPLCFLFIPLSQLDSAKQRDAGQDSSTVHKFHPKIWEGFFNPSLCPCLIIIQFWLVMPVEFSCQVAVRLSSLLAENSVHKAHVHCPCLHGTLKRLAYAFLVPSGFHAPSACKKSHDQLKRSLGPKRQFLWCATKDRKSLWNFSDHEVKIWTLCLLLQQWAPTSYQWNEKPQ